MTPEQEDQLAKLLRLAAQRVTRNFGTEYQDTVNECWAWALDKERYDKLVDWLGNGRFVQAFNAVVEGVGRNGFGRREKAHRTRRDPRDLWRNKRDQFSYSVPLIDQLLPMATNPDWQPGDDQVFEKDGGFKRHTRKAPSEWGNSLAMVMDVRRALSAGCSRSEDIAAWLNGGAA